MQWYYSNEGQRSGPVTTEEIRSLIVRGVINPSTLLWNQNMANWAPLPQVAEFAPPPAAPTPSASVAPPPPAVSTPAPAPATIPPSPAAPVATGAGVPPGAPNAGGLLAFAIVTTVFCCLPLGIPAIVFAAQINAKVAAGDMAGAWDSARKAKLFAWIAVACGLLGMVIYAIMVPVFTTHAAPVAPPHSIHSL